MAQKSSIVLAICMMVLSAAAKTGKITFPPEAPPVPELSKSISSSFYSEELKRVLDHKKKESFILGKTMQGRKIEAHYFPGTSEKRALIIGGVHGSELSSIEVAKALLSQLNDSTRLYYNVIVIPSLFPDNAETARKFPSQIGDVKNIGRYSYAGAVDPNRQMPSPGRPFDEDVERDHAGRKIEYENTLLLDLIDQYRPQRIVNLHAIRDTQHAGVFADPRTDHQSIALGYESDSSLAISIAREIQQHGGYIPGNNLNEKPTAVYYKDPVPVAAGQFQKRNFTGSTLPGHRGGGISLGTWAATAVVDDHNPSKNRDAMRILTMEFPGSRRPVDYSSPAEQGYWENQVAIFAAALKNVFLQENFVEAGGS
jgi:hypothetical protein